MRRCYSTAVFEDLMSTLTSEYNDYLVRSAFVRNEFDVYEHPRALFKVEADPMEILQLLMSHSYIELSHTGENKYLASMNLRTLTEMARKTTYHGGFECVSFVPYLREISPAIADCVENPPKEAPSFSGQRISLSNAKMDSNRRSILVACLTSQEVNKIESLPFEELIKHAHYTIELEGISRIDTHQFVRHRRVSYSQESQRFSAATREGVVFPDSVLKNSLAVEKAEQAVRGSYEAYESLISSGIPKEDARFFLPGGLKTKLLFTTTARQLMHMAFFRSDYSDIGSKAQWEIRDTMNKSYEAAASKDDPALDNRLPRHIEEINL